MGDGVGTIGGVESFLVEAAVIDDDGDPACLNENATGDEVSFGTLG